MPPAKLLPPSDGLPIERLAGLFDSTTTSYKHLFFHGLLTMLERGDYLNEEFSVSFARLELEMVVSAYHTAQHWNLSLGFADRASDCAAYLGKDQNKKSENALRIAAREKSQAIRKANLLRFVPYKMLSPWLRGRIPLGDGAQHVGAVHEITTNEFWSLKPLYKTPPPNTPFADRSIIMHPEWIHYLLKHIGIIRKWADMHWIDYLQKRNPNAPALATKLWFPEDRNPLTRQRKLWDSVLQRLGGIKCIYTGDKIEKEYALDHFLPFSWIGHDQMWNLIPTSSETNARKSNRIPDEPLVDALAKTHSEALLCLKEEINKQSLRKLAEDYQAGLRLGQGDLLSSEKLSTAYQTFVKPQVQIARNYGFERWGHTLRQ